MTNGQGETALFRAARYGKTPIFEFLAEKISGYDEAAKQPFIQRNDKTTILHAAVLTHHFGLALKIARQFSHIISERDEDGMTALQLLSCDRAAFETVRRRGRLKRVLSSVNKHWSSAGDKVDQKEKSGYESALVLAKLLGEKDTSWEFTKSAFDTSKPKPYKSGSSSSDIPSAETGDNVDEKDRRITPLFLATKSGCIEIVKAILETYPQAVEHLDEKGQTILHVAIKYRQLEVFELVSKMEVALRWLVRRLDKGGNSILHMVGMQREEYVPEKLRGPALQLQDELLWFERVKSISKGHFINHRNKKKQTAEGLFATSYKELRDNAREWIKHTAEGCSVVAVLIATVAFAAAYTIPGGSNQNTGLPLLLSQPLFGVFTATDVLSLACALTAVVIFLSILTSPFRFDNFKQSLPNKLMLGFTFLFLSVSMMMLSFAATIILMIRNNQSWKKIVMYSLSFLPVSIFGLSYIPLYVSLSRTYKFLLQKIKQAIPLSIWLPSLRHCYNRTGARYTNPTRPKSEREDSYSLDAPQTSHSSV